MATLSGFRALTTTPLSLLTSRHATSCSSSTSKERNSGCWITTVRCSHEESPQEKTASRVGKPVQCLAVASMAAAVLLSSTSQATAEDFNSKAGSMCTLAALPERSEVLKLEAGENAFEEDGQSMPLVMGGMSMKNFNPARYSGRWFEVASLKLGFSGQGQGDCHCTQGVYTFDEENRAIKVDTFCVHGSPTGYITGIRGKVQCVSDEELSKLQSDLERMQMIQQKCFLRFPSIPFIPKQPYNVLNTDYDNFALVSGARDTSFVQIYSRTPNPGPEFIEKYKNELKDLGYNPELIKDTPQDCEVMSMPQLEKMMSRPGMEEAMTNVFPTLELSDSGLQLNPFTSTFETLRKLLVETFFK
ncbi:unnamed protein product [Calypogeia fissa]